ncbi:hypothetical protein [Streptomyces sp. NPDC005533]|uniref:hypothetical protein n=1 Tax=Streptomyces sp. NPDC005533 TaxID=3364723 RepID=UPI00368530CD
MRRRSGTASATTGRERELSVRQCGDRLLLVLSTDDAGRSPHVADLYGNVIVAARPPGS